MRLWPTFRRGPHRGLDVKPAKPFADGSAEYFLAQQRCFDAPSKAAQGRYIFSDIEKTLAVVGDIHGRIDLLQTLAVQIDEQAARSPKRLLEIYLGDYVDHAGDARAVLEFLSARKLRSDRDVICLMGNHEQMMLAALDDDTDFVRWVELGGYATLKSYGVSTAGVQSDPNGKRMSFRAAIPQTHLDFLRGLRIYHAEREFFFVHAGVRPGTTLENQSTEDLLWIRDAFLKSTDDFGAVIVHGHSPSPLPQFLSNRIGIDTGAYYSGELTCLIIDAAGVCVLPSRSAVQAD